MGQQHDFFQAVKPYLLLMRVDRPIGFLLLLWPTWWALWAAAEGTPPIGTWVIFTIGVFLMRSAGCVINDLADKDVDGAVKRTAGRPLVQNMLTTKNAWLLFAGLMVVAACLLLFLQKLTVLLALVAAFLAVTYPFMKRITSLPQIYLGLAFGMSIPMAYAEITGTVPKVAWVLFIANVFWTTAYDTIYAMVDRKDDIKAGIRSTAILFGDLDRVIIGIIQLLTLLCLYLFGDQNGYGPFYNLALITVVWIFLFHQLLIMNRLPEKCFKAFLHNNWVGLVVFVGIFLNFILKTS
ncbi:4-hydroxybenzoate octaprenyltransferase [Marinicella sp. W31]|uniref:4-hydroxybenzoate octaprenyltransferase n=1 Tax=Marinicella sp. W31 TaxID=3023713 RepID=UPI00375751C0